jgi:ATP synthase protein I
VETPTGLELSDSNENESSKVSSSGETSMDEYYRLQRRLMMTTLTFTVIIFLSVWLAYSLHIALNYLIGACTGMVYLRMLSRNVERIGRSAGGVSSGRLALIAAMILVASQWSQLEIMPVFLGFLTYKVALIGYTLWTTFVQE